MYSFLFINFVIKPIVPLKQACRHKDLFCSISDTNYHLEKRNNSKKTSTNLLERAPHSAGFTIRFVGVVVDPCQSMVGLRYPFSKDYVMARY